MIYLILLIMFGIISLFVDKSFSSFMFSIRSGFLSSFVYYTLLILKEYILLIFSVIILYFKDKKKIINAVIGFFLTGFVVTILKYFINRPRPFEVILNSKLNIFDYSFASFNTSFPSWHTAAAFSLLPFVFYFNKKLGYLWIAISILIGFARIYTGFHYLSDVLFGGLIGYLIGYLSLKKFNYF